MIEQSLLEKIQHLLAMAEHPNSNPNEAAIAMEMAQALLLKHNLTLAQVRTNDTSYTPPPGIGKIEVVESLGYSWKATLLNTIAKSSLCYVVGSPSKHQASLFGSYDNVKVVLEMYNWLKTQLDFMAGRDWVTYQHTGGMERVNSWKAGFYNGAMSEIRVRLQKPYQEFAQGQGSALVIYNDKALSIAAHKVFPNIGKSYARASGSQDGIYSGRQAGRNVTLSQQRQLGSRLALPA